MQFLTRRILRHYLMSTKLVSFDAKDSLLGRLNTRAGNHGDNHVFTMHEVIHDLLEGFHELQQDAMHRDWHSLAQPEDFQAIERYQRHLQKRPASVAADPG